MKDKQIEKLATKAYEAITNGIDWENCDEETGRECRGEKCKFGAHRAAHYLYEIVGLVS